SPRLLSALNSSAGVRAAARARSASARPGSLCLLGPSAPVAQPLSTRASSHTLSRCHCHAPVVGQRHDTKPECRVCCMVFLLPTVSFNDTTSPVIRLYGLQHLARMDVCLCGPGFLTHPSPRDMALREPVQCQARLPRPLIGGGDWLGSLYGRMRAQLPAEPRARDAPGCSLRVAWSARLSSLLQKCCIVTVLHEHSSEGFAS